MNGVYVLNATKSLAISKKFQTEKIMNNIDYDKLREIFKLGKEKVK